jgi:hypothetical protein
MMLEGQEYGCVVEVGGLPISIRTSDQQFLDSLRQRYAGFLSGARAEAELELEHCTYPSAATDEEVTVRQEGQEWIVQRGDFQAGWDPGTGRGRIRQNRNPYAVDSVIRIVHSLILARRGGFLLHAASGICDGKAYLFSGVSGAGKTTMTRLAPKDVVLLTDEISYVRPSEGQYSAFGTPFTGELARSGEKCSAPIAALFFLEKGSENRVDPVPAPLAVERLMRNILFFAHDRKLIEMLFATACEFVGRIPVCQLTFYPDARAWDEIKNFAREAVHA